MLDEPVQKLYDCTVQQVQQGHFQKCTVVIRKRDLSDDIIEKQTFLIQKLKHDNTSLKRLLQNKVTQMTHLKHCFDQLQQNNMHLNQQTLVLIKDNQNISFLQTFNADLRLENQNLNARLKKYESQFPHQEKLAQLQRDVDNLRNQNSLLRQVDQDYQKHGQKPNNQIQQLQRKCKELQDQLIMQKKINQTLAKDVKDNLSASQSLKQSESAVICTETGIKGTKQSQDLEDNGKERQVTGQNKIFLHQSCYSVESIEGNQKSMSNKKSEAEIQTQKCEIYEPVVSRQRLEKSLSSRRNNHMKSVDEHTRLLSLSRQLNEKEEEIKQLVKKVEKQRKHSESVKSKLKQKEKQLKMIKKNSTKRDIIVVEDDDKEVNDSKPAQQVSSALDKVQQPERNQIIGDEQQEIDVNQFHARENNLQEQQIVEIQEQALLKQVILQTEPLQIQQYQQETQWKIYAEHLEGKLFKLQINNRQSQEENHGLSDDQVTQQVIHEYIDNLGGERLHQQEGPKNEKYQEQEQKKIVANTREEDQALHRQSANRQELLQSQIISQRINDVPILSQAYPAQKMQINFRIVHDEDSQTGQGQLAALRAEVSQLRSQLAVDAEEEVVLTEVVTQTEQLQERQIIDLNQISKTDQIDFKSEVYAYTAGLQQKMAQKLLNECRIQTKQKELLQKQAIISELRDSIVKCRWDNEQLRKMLALVEQQLQQEQQEGKRIKDIISSANEQIIRKYEEGKMHAIIQIESSVYAITIADKIAHQLADQANGEEASIVENSFLPSNTHEVVFNLEDNLFQSSSSLGNLDGQFHLKYEKLLKEIQGLRDQNKYLHELLAQMKSFDLERSASQNRDMVVSFNIKDSKIIQLEHILAIPLKPSAICEKEKVRESVQNIQSLLLKEPQVKRTVEQAEIPRLDTGSLNLQTSYIKQLSPIPQPRQKIERLSEQLQAKEQQIAELKLQLEKIQSKLQKSKKLMKKAREGRSRNEQIQIEEEEIVLAEVETQTHPQMFENLQSNQNIEDFCDQLQYRLQLETNKNASLKSKLRRHRSTIKKMQSEQSILPISDTTELQIEEQNVQMCEVEVQVNLSHHDNSHKRTEDERMNQQGKLFLNVIENLENKYMDEDSEENQSQNCSQAGKAVVRNKTSNQQQLFKDEKPGKAETQAQNATTIKDKIDLSQLQILFIERQIADPQSSLLLNPLFIRQVEESFNSLEVFNAAVFKLAPLTADKIRCIVNTATADLTQIQVALAEAQWVEQDKLEQVVRLCGVENIDRLTKEI